MTSEITLPLNMDEINGIAMQVLVHCGNAQTLLMEILKKLPHEMDSVSIRSAIENAKISLSEANSAQSDLIQKATEGGELPYSLLFNHAQDTLMMVKNQQLIIQGFTDAFIELNNRLIKLENSK